MEGEQTWPTEDELKEAEENASSKPRTKRVPKGTSDYQAAWILENDDGEYFFFLYKGFDSLINSYLGFWSL